MRRFLAIWLPDWPVQRLTAAQPELSGRAVVLHGRDPRRGEVVRACSEQALRQGLRPGLPLAEAAALLRGESPRRASAQRAGAPPHFAAYEPQRDRQALTDLALACEQFSPLVGWEDDGEPEGLRLDITGLASLFGGEPALAQQIAEFFQQRGYQIRIAIADTPAAAAAVARCAGVSSAELQPCAVVILPPGQASLLGELPVAALRLPPAVEQQLQQLGLRRLSQLQALSRGSLAARLGHQLLERLDRITGAVQEAIVACPRPPDFTVRQTFEHPLTHREAIEQVVERLLEKLSRRLIARGHGVLQLECRLAGSQPPPRVLCIGLFQPAVDPEHLASLARVQLERLQLPDGLQQIQVQAVATAPRQQRQSTLFDVAAHDSARLAELVERLSNRVGRERIVRPDLQAEAQVELAYRCRPLTGERPRQAAQAGGPAACPGPMLRPLKLFDPPRRVEVIGIAGEGPPAVFFYQQQSYRVVRHWGPERIETGWWRGPSCRRDYYRVETESGCRLWLFRRLQDQQWFLHGEFE